MKMNNTINMNNNEVTLNNILKIECNFTRK